MKPSPVKTALIGSGAISHNYLGNMTRKFSILEVVGCSDLIPERSERRAAQFGIRQMTNEEIWDDPDIRIVVNTTYPLSHYEVTKRSLLAGKNVHCEKMLAVTLGEGFELVALAKEKGLRLGLAPDTFLGGGLQTARLLLDSGMIGEPLHAAAMVVRGYHSRGESSGNILGFTMQPGGGIPFDMGGYYLHALLSMLGPVRRVSGFCRTRGPKTHENPRHGFYKEPFEPGSPNMLVGALEFQSGVYGTLATFSEGWREFPRLEIYGTEGTLVLPDPNTFSGPVYLMRQGSDQRYEMPLTHGYTDGCQRGLGVADMAWALRNGRPHRCSGEMGLHAFEIVHGIWESSRTGQAHEMKSTMERPKALRSGVLDGTAAEAVLDD